MRVVIDITFARRAPYSGTAIYLERLIAELNRLPDVDVVTASNARRRAPAGGGRGSVRNLLTDAWWATLELPRLARRMGADVVHHPLPARSPGGHLPQVITVHDLAFERLPKQFAPGFRLFAHHTHRAAARAAGAVICVSETTAADVRELWRIPDGRIVIAPHGPGQELSALASPPLEGCGYFLYVGDAEPRKNLGTLLDAYRRYRDAAEHRPLELVLCGSAHAAAEGVRVEHQPSPGRLAELYSGATALVHPSLYEGFGLTVLEAMSAGTPVLAARAPGVLEVCGDAAYYAQAHEPDSFAAAMVEIASTAALRLDLSERGRRRASDFSWAASARAHVDAYSLALKP